jgi:hypothetical protein
MTNRETWAQQAVEALGEIVVMNKRKSDPASPAVVKQKHERPRITARDWLALREQRAFDIAYTQSAAAEIALKRLMNKGGK